MTAGWGQAGWRRGRALMSQCVMCLVVLCVCVCSILETTQYQGHSQARLMVLLERLSSRELRPHPPAFRFMSSLVTRRRVTVMDSAQTPSHRAWPPARKLQRLQPGDKRHRFCHRLLLPLAHFISSSHSFFFVVKKILTARCLSIDQKTRGGCSSSRFSLLGLT